MFVGDVIKVVGIGSTGCQVVNRLFKAVLPNIELLAISDDYWELKRSLAPVRFEINLKKLRESRNEVQGLIGKADLVILVADLAESSSGEFLSFIAEISKKAGATTIGFVAQSPNSETVDTVKRLRKYMDTLVVIPEEGYYKNTNNDISPFLNGASFTCELSYVGARSLIDYLFGPICASIADIKACFTSQSGQGMIGNLSLAYGSDEGRAIEAAKVVCSSPLLCRPISEAQSVLIVIAGNEKLKIAECSEAAELLRTRAAPGADMLISVGLDESLGDMVRISLIGAWNE